jgi:Cdc6-like AAA superfamily ATPase
LIYLKKSDLKNMDFNYSVLKEDNMNISSYIYCEEHEKESKFEAQPEGQNNKSLLKRKRIRTLRKINDITEKLMQGEIIYCREKEREQIKKFLIESGNKNLYICGQPGTGKTSLVNQILRGLPDKKFSLKFYFNCMCFRNANDFYTSFFDHIKKNEEILKTAFSSSEISYINQLIINTKKAKFISTEGIKEATLEIIEMFKNKFIL